MLISNALIDRFRGTGVKQSVVCSLYSIAVAALVLSVATAPLSYTVAADSQARPSQTAPTSGAGAAEMPSKLDDPCRAASSYPSPEYPFPVYSATQIAAMLKPPRDVPDLLWNLRLVFDRKLLVQPRFFEDEVLLRVFNGTAIRWVEPGTPDVAGDWVIKPKRIARITIDRAFAGMKVDVGVSHRCLDRRPNPADPGITIPPHTYDSGYIRLRFPPFDGFTLGAVRKVFGPNPGSFDVLCKEALPLSYPTNTETDSAAFLLNVAEFRPDETGYQELCRSRAGVELPDERLVSAVSIRLIEDDHTFPPYATPGVGLSIKH
jgi:hypothetical protein